MQNRRQFLTNLVRGGIFVSMTLLGGILVRRWGEADECHRSFACRGCTLSERCTLPEAEEYRHDRQVPEKTVLKNGRDRK
jgi:hypothetical protein